MSGGRSRLHLLDLGSCESDITRTRDGGGGQCLSLAALGNVILALANGAKHVPYRYVSVQHVKYQLNVRYSISRSIDIDTLICMRILGSSSHLSYKLCKKPCVPPGRKQLDEYSRTCKRFHRNAYFLQPACALH